MKSEVQTCESADLGDCGNAAGRLTGSAMNRHTGRAIDCSTTEVTKANGHRGLKRLIRVRMEAWRQIRLNAKAGLREPEMRDRREKSGRRAKPLSLDCRKYGTRRGRQGFAGKELFPESGKTSFPAASRPGLPRLVPKTAGNQGKEAKCKEKPQFRNISA